MWVEKLLNIRMPLIFRLHIIVWSVLCCTQNPFWVKDTFVSKYEIYQHIFFYKINKWAT